MHAGVASSLDPQSMMSRFARRARQRRRVYQSGKGRATNRGGPGGRQAHRGPVGSARDLPRPAPRQRPGPAYEVSFAGRSAVFRRRRFGPALLREAPRCSCPAVACGDRGVSDSTWAAGLLFGADGVAVTVSVDRTAGDASLATATASSATTVPASIKDICRVPSRPRASREAAACRMRCPPRPRAGAWRIRSIRPHRPSIERHGASVPTRVHLPPQPRHTRVSRNCDLAPGRRHPRAMSGAPAPDFHRLSGLPVCRDGSRLTLPQGSSHMAATIAPAPWWHQNNLVSTLAATGPKADLAPRHYRSPARPLLRAAG